MERSKTWLIALLLTLTIGLAPNAEARETSPPLAGVQFEQPLPKNLWVEMAKRINPAVVNISSTAAPVPRDRSRPPGHDPFFDMLEEFFGVPRGQLPYPSPREGQAMGTGFLIRPDGLILTNSHVVSGASTVQVSLLADPKKQYQAEVVGRDHRGDIALIKIEAGNKLPYLQLGRSDKMEVGDWVAAFGNPFGHTNTMTVGIISAKGREIDELNRFPFLQTDASINPGNSGGPLVNTEGYVIGVNTAIDARAQGIGFAIPVDYVRSVLPTLEKEGTIRRGFLGVNIAPITPRIANSLQLKSLDGALVSQVIPGSPAAKGGLREYDIIMEFNGEKITSPADLTRRVQDTPVGKTVSVDVLRIDGSNGKRETKSLKVSVGENPEDVRLQKESRQRTYKGQKAPYDLGFTVADWSVDIARSFGISEGAPKRPIVIEVSPKSSAAEVGLRPGDLILDVNKAPIRDAKSVVQKLKKGDNLLRVHRDGAVALLVLSAS